ncbi:MAG: carboxypeptidase-like regulatory domain-containing protein, partial [Acidobacteriota bacterium]|nr:carboxypeptidase-like regulatory domain-containing protein [Acidobacteriota bacterium]
MIWKNHLVAKWAALLACLTVCLLSVPPVARAQNISGSILGTITDNSGAVIPGASVTVTNQDTGIEAKTQSGGAGEYVLANLPPGTYKVRIES